MNRAGVYHSDVSAWNVVRCDSQGSTTRLCPRHKKEHKWRIIDFDRAVRIDTENTNEDGSWVLKYFDKNDVGRDTSFWGVEREC